MWLSRAPPPPQLLTYLLYWTPRVVFHPFVRLQINSKNVQMGGDLWVSSSSASLPWRSRATLTLEAVETEMMRRGISWEKPCWSCVCVWPQAMLAIKPRFWGFQCFLKSPFSLASLCKCNPHYSGTPLLQENNPMFLWRCLLITFGVNGGIPLFQVFGFEWLEK